MSAQTLKYNTPSKTFSELYTCLAKKHYDYRKYGVGEDIKINDIIELLISDKICNNNLKNKYL